MSAPGARPTELSPEDRARLLETARRGLERAYAPYSRFRVGAAVLTGSGAVYPGCNVENASYGLTICAERAAVFRAVAEEGGAVEVRAVAAITDGGGASPPCGACRQVLYEFGPEAVVLFTAAHGVEEARLADLLPAGFRLEPGIAGDAEERRG